MTKNLGMTEGIASGSKPSFIIHLRSALVILSAIMAASEPAQGILVPPVSYTATPGEGIAQGGFYNYFDDTGRQLTDGTYGTNNFAANLGNGIAYEWVGWLDANPTITFQFSAPVTITQVGIDFNRNQANQIYLPGTVDIGGTSFWVPTDALPDDSRGTLDFNGAWTGSTLQICLADNDSSRWIFVDEITFASTPVPEPSSVRILCLLGSFAAGCLWMLPRKKTAG